MVELVLFVNLLKIETDMADLILEITKLSIADRIKLVQEILGIKLKPQSRRAIA